MRLTLPYKPRLICKQHLGAFLEKMFKDRTDRFAGARRNFGFAENYEAAA